MDLLLLLAGFGLVVMATIAWVAFKLFKFAVTPGPNHDLVWTLKRVLALSAALLITIPFWGKFAQDSYRNYLCATEAKASVLVSAEDWSPPQVDDAWDSRRAEKQGARWRSYHGLGLIHDHHFPDRGFGVIELRDEWIDGASGKVLARITSFQTGRGGGKSFFDYGLPLPQACRQHIVHYQKFQRDYTAKSRARGGGGSRATPSK